MDWSLVFIILIAFFFFILGAGCVFSVILGLPGSWIILALAVLLELIDGWWLPETKTSTFGIWFVNEWWLIIVCGLLAGVGEVLEFIAGMLGAKKGGASRRGMWGALIGGIGGAFLGIAIPIPIIGSLIGAAIGTFAGAIIGELSAPTPTTDDEGETTTGSFRENFRGSLKPATGATIGRILGTLSKLPIAVLIWLALTVAAFWP